MSSTTKPSEIDLERDLPTTATDVAALRRAGAWVPEDPFAAVQALHDALPEAARRPRRETAAGRPPFEL